MPCRNSKGGEIRGAEAEFKAVIGGTGGDPGGDPSGCPCPSRMPLAMGDEYVGMADGAAVDSKWGRTGCAGMSRCPLPAI